MIDPIALAIAAVIVVVALWPWRHKPEKGGHGYYPTTGNDKANGWGITFDKDMRE